METFNLEEINKEYIHDLTDDEIERAKNKDSAYAANTESKLNDNDYGKVYKSSFDVADEKKYRGNIFNLLKICHDIFKENHNGYKFEYIFKTKTIEEKLNITFDYATIGHIFGFDDEKIFSKKRAAKEKMDILTDDFCTNFSEKATEEKFNFFITYKDSIIANEESKYRNFNFAAFNYGKLYTKLSSYINYANLHEGRAYITSKKLTQEEIKKEKDNGKSAKDIPKYYYFLKTANFNVLEKYRVCELQLFKENDFYKSLSLKRRVSNNNLEDKELKEKLILGITYPKITEPSGNVMEYITEKTEEEKLNDILENSNNLYKDANIFLKNNKEISFIMNNYDELFGILIKIKSIEVRHLNHIPLYRNIKKAIYDESLSILLALDLEESTCIDDFTREAINKIIDRKKYFDEINNGFQVNINGVKRKIIVGEEYRKNLYSIQAKQAILELEEIKEYFIQLKNQEKRKIK